MGELTAGDPFAPHRTAPRRVPLTAEANLSPTPSQKSTTPAAIVLMLFGARCEQGLLFVFD